MLRLSPLLLIGGGLAVVVGLPGPVPTSATFRHSWASARSVEGPAIVGDNEVIEEYCLRCHNDRRLRGNMSLEAFDAENAAESAELAERMIRKLFRQCPLGAE